MTTSRRRTRLPRLALAASTVTAVAVALTVSVGMPTSAAPRLTTDPASSVDPLIGSTNAGNTFPGAVAPFGMLAWSPDQSAVASDGALHTPSPSGYEYGRNTIRGFGLTHVSGAGCAGLSGDLPFMPLTTAVTTSPAAADVAGTPMQSTFSHANEKATPGSYRVTLDSGVDVRLAATTRTGSGVFTYPKESPATMLIRTSDSLVGSSAADVSVNPRTRTVTGSVTSGNFCGGFTGDGILQKSYYTVHFVAQFDTDIAEVGTWQDGTLQPGSTSASDGTTYPGGYPPAGKGSGAYLRFDTGTHRAVGVRVGISYVSEANAKRNLNAENPAGTTVAQVERRTHDAWNTELNRIRTAGGTAAENTTFSTALYHSLMHPNITSDVNRQYTGFDLKTHRVPKAQDAQYATFSGWDVYRSQLQLVTLLDPKRGSDIAASLLNQANQNGGVWDRWTHNSGTTHVMNGDPSAAALAGIVAFGGTSFDVAGAYASLATAARVPTTDDASRAGWNIAVVGQRPSLAQFLKYGYYPEGCNAWGCPNETLEMGAADAGLATLAQYLGKEADVTEFQNRSQSWQNQFNPHATADAGYIQGRLADGTWTTGFDPASSDGFVEGTSAQYTWMVQHDPAGLFAAMGGRDVAAQRLDGFFHEVGDENGNGIPGEWTLAGGSWDTNLHANVDNEPSIETPWLYNYAGQPWKTQETVRQTIQQLWIDTKDGAPNGPDGIPGNDDLGEMSSWLVFAAMGLYPENPSRAELTVAAPLFSEVQLHRASGPVLDIRAPQASPSTPYIQSMRVDGRATQKTYLDATTVTRDTVVDYRLSAAPNTKWGTDADDAPPSQRAGEQAYLTSASPAAVTAAPGGTTSAVTLEAQQVAEDAAPATYTVDAPAGLTADHATGTLTAGDHGLASAQVILTADAGLAEGDYPVTVHFASGGAALRDATFTVTVAQPVDVLASTSFEVGQFAPTPNVRVDATGMDEYCCGVGGVETKVQGGDQPHSGTQSVIFSGRAVAADATASNQLVDVDAIAVHPGERLDYWVKPQVSGGPFGDYVQDASPYVAVDLLFTDGTRLSSLAPTASNGAALTASAQGGVLKSDTWNHVTTELPAAVEGKQVDQALLTFAPGSHFGTASDSKGYFRGWVDDLALTQPIAVSATAPATRSTTGTTDPAHD